MHPPLAQAAHRLCANWAMSWRALGRIVAPSPVVSCLCPSVSLSACVHWRAVSRVGPTILQSSRRDTENCVAIQLLPRALSRAPSAVSQRAPCNVVDRVARCIATQKSPPRPQYSFQEQCSRIVFTNSVPNSDSE